MLKNLTIIFAIICFSSVHAQYEWTPAKVTLKNGTSFRGLVQFPKHSNNLIFIGSSKFKYKKKSTNKAVTLNKAIEDLVSKPSGLQGDSVSYGDIN